MSVCWWLVGLLDEIDERTDLPADMVGQVWSLHMGSPVLVSIS